MRALRSVRIRLPIGPAGALGLFAACVLGWPGAASAQGGDQPNLVSLFADWGAYLAAPGGKKVCFALSKPTTSKTEPAGRKRDPAFLFVSNRPAENVRNEVSLIIGYPFKPSSDASVEVGTAKFVMQTKDDGAWFKNMAEEARFIEAMRKGADLTVKGVSGRGTATVDQFSLKGLSQALDRADRECK
jgi:hypothetical protein